jgi:hypothetical protein
MAWLDAIDGARLMIRVNEGFNRLFDVCAKLFDEIRDFFLRILVLVLS